MNFYHCDGSYDLYVYDNGDSEQSVNLHTIGLHTMESDGAMQVDIVKCTILINFPPSHQPLLVQLLPFAICQCIEQRDLLMTGLSSPKMGQVSLAAARFYRLKTIDIQGGDTQALTIGRCLSQRSRPPNT